MEFFNKAKAVRLKSHHEKYLYADDDGVTVRQDRNGSSRRAWWAVETVEGTSHVIRLRSFHGKYLTASDEAILLGMTGKKVSQTLPATKHDEALVEWEPRADGYDRVKLRTRGGKYLRANGGAPPWRNSITHDIPHRTKTQSWILWLVDVVDIHVVEMMTAEESVAGRLLLRDSSFSSESEVASVSDGSDFGSPMSVGSGSFGSEFGSLRKESAAMELFKKAKSIRLRSHLDKYLLAVDDEETVVQDRNGSVRNARWSIEFVEASSNSDVANVIRLKSCFGKYLTASNMPFLMGMTGKKVLQTLPPRLDSSIEWEPIREGFQVRLKTRYGQFLRANGGLPPWRNSVTHDIPHRTSTQDWILWDVDVVEIRPQTPPRRIMAPPVESPAPAVPSSPFRRRPAVREEEPESEPESEPGSPVKVVVKSEREKNASFNTAVEGRKIYYRVSDGTEDDLEDIEEILFIFRGKGIEELKQKLKEETELEDISVCSRNLLNGELYPLRLHLPPNNTEMHVVVVMSSSSGR